ncbi:sensor histidine kinase [Nocardioides stalactiti]|uniref:sensor histidine kinase n=1 Tax=Nocardioides stalactiti TaxID=2755356 RepID=UPI001FEB4DB7|nr:HAMP domain-containing sensor histidine kinase [Nocardioides stalactiti]
MTATTEQRAPQRSGLSVRVRITAAVALLVSAALAGAGLIVYLIEVERVEASVEREVEQELDEFGRLQRVGVDPQTGRRFDVEGLLTAFLRRNVPDDDELLVGWVRGRPKVYFPDDDLVRDPVFLAAAAPLVSTGGSTRIDTADGEVRITSQPVRQGQQTGALLVVAYLDEDRAELAATMRTYAIVALLSMLVITGAAWWQAGRLLAPLRTLRRTADEISATDLSRRVPETGNDDITALTHTVNGMLDRLESAFVGQRQFLDDAGHELRTPLTVLRGHLELLDEGDPSEVAETRTLLLDEVDRMARLVSDLIVLAKSERPDFLSVRPADPADLTATVLAKARGLGERTWRLEITSLAAGETVVLDPQRLTQALLQLADNAVKHTTVGDEVVLGAGIDAGTLTFWVRDGGRGVRPEDRERIFQRFGRAVVPQGDEGFGLGLSIVSAIARAHGGRAYVDETSRFVIALPVVRQTPQDDQTSTTRLVPTEETWHGS